MRIMPVLFFAAAATQLTAFAAPQTSQPAPSSSTQSALSEIQVRGALQRYQLQPAQVDELKGVYKLDNGAVLKVTNVHRRLFAQLGERGLTELVPIAENRFVSSDQRMTMQYHPRAFGDEIVLTYPADLNLADARMVTARLAVN